MAITPQFKDELRARVRLSDIIGRKVKLTRAGTEFKGCCPFHHEKTPSFTVNDQKQFYHCFGCGAHGDVINFVMAQSNLPFMEAIEMLASEAGMEVPKPSPQEAQAYKKQDRLMACVQEAASWFQAQLFAPENKEILNYALGRGLSEETLHKFKLGFGPFDRHALPRFLKEKGFSDNEMVETCLAKKPKGGGEPYSFFRERLIFPVTDGRGRTVAFGGRILPDEMLQPSRSDFKPPKYMNSSDTPLFHKGHMVFNEFIARGSAAKDNTVIITEGYMDVIALVQAGFDGAIAPLGTALTEQQIKLTWHMIPAELKEPFICFDGDNAGRRAAERAIERMLPLIGPGQSARFIFMPEGEDPDSLIKKKGVAAFKEFMANALPMVEVIWQNLIEGQVFDTPERLAGLEKSIGAVCEQIQDGSVQYHYRSKLKQKMRDQFRPQWTPNFSKKKKEPSIRLSSPTNPSQKQRIEATLLYAFYKYPQLLDQFEDAFALIHPNDPMLLAYKGQLWDAYLAGEELDGDDFDPLKELISIHGQFLENENDFTLIEKGVNELLQNLRGHGNTTSLGESARALLENSNDEEALRENDKTVSG